MASSAREPGAGRWLVAGGRHVAACVASRHAGTRPRAVAARRGHVDAPELRPLSANSKELKPLFDLCRNRLKNGAVHYKIKIGPCSI